MAMLAGRRDMMELIADGTVMHGGTVNSNIMSMAAAWACLQRLIERDGAAIKQLYSTGTALTEGLRELASKDEIEALIQGPGPGFAMTFSDAPEIADYRSHRRNADEERYACFYRGMLERGVRLVPRGIWFVSTAHTESDIQQTLAAADEALATL